LVSNNTGQKGDLKILGQTSIDSATYEPGQEPLPVLQFAGQPQAKLSTPIDLSQTQVYRFPMIAGEPGTSQFQFQTQLGGAGDAFAVPLEVKAHTDLEQVFISGTNRAEPRGGSGEIPLQINANMTKDVGGLEISLASTLIPQLRLPAAQVLDAEQLPLLEPAASQLLLAANLQQLGAMVGQSFTEFQPQQRAAAAVAALQKLQRPEGGFAAWPGAKESDPLLSGYAAQAIAQARPVFDDQAVAAQLKLDQLQTYLQSYLANPSQNNFCAGSELCKLQLRLEMLLGLDALGDRRGDFLAELVAARQRLDRVSQIRLATYLSQFPQWQTEAAAQFQQIQETVYQTGRTITESLTSRLPAMALTNPRCSRRNSCGCLLPKRLAPA
jgi:alpha-2-macroglobulin